MQGVTLLLLVAFAFGLYPQTEAAAVSAACAERYTVQAGDTLTAIAFAYDVTLEELADANGLTDPYVIYIGQVLCIPASSTSNDSDTDSEADSDDDGDVSVDTDGLYLDVTASDMTKRSIFYVKARSWRNRFPGEWYKLGLLHMGKNSSLTDSYRLPTILREKDALEVCLKDVSNDDLYCTVIGMDF